MGARSMKLQLYGHRMTHVLGHRCGSPQVQVHRVTGALGYTYIEWQVYSAPDIQNDKYIV